VPEGQARPTEFAPGYYLFASEEWDAIGSATLARRDAWQVLWRGDLEQRKKPTPLVFVRRRA